jgi:hypothetical protein
MYSILNGFILCTHALGLGSVLAVCSFLEDVVYEPIRSSAVPWPVAFECVIVYLRLIESNPSSYNLATVVSSAGGIDAHRAVARANASQHYSAAFFRVLGGNPNDLSSPDHKGGIYSGSVKGDNKSSKMGCASWNTGSPHYAKNVDTNGKCKFIHACDQFVSDKGKNGQCLGPHKRKDCDYDSSKKVSKPASN